MNFYKIDKISNERELEEQADKLKEDLLNNNKVSYCEICGIFTKGIKVVILDKEKQYLPKLPDGKIHAVAFFLCYGCHMRLNQDILDKLIIRNYQ